jgi:phosphoglycerol transferase MdoB-like AlkP superfamily enzyme
MSPIRYVIRLYIFSLVLLSLTRFLLWGLYYDYFSALSIREILLAFLMGIRIDTITLNTFAGVLILLLLLPWVQNRSYRKTVSLLWLFVLLIIIVGNIVDTVYFGFFHKHLDLGLVLMNNDIDPIIDFAKSYLLQIGELLLFLSIISFAWIKLIDVDISFRGSISYWIKTFLIIVFLVLGIRGFTLKGKPFRVSDAFVSEKIASAHLAVSGFYSLYRGGGSHVIQLKVYPDSEALKTTRKLLHSPIAPFVDDNYPIKRQFINNGTVKKYNYVIIMIESFSSRFVDSFNGNIGLKATPCFDKLAEKGLKFDNAFANGRQSIAGITALFAGLVPPPGTSLYLGKGLESVRLSYLGSLFKKSGYETLAMQSSKRRSFRIDSVARLAGFQHYYGAEDFSRNQHGEDPDKAPTFGAWDGDMFTAYLQKINQMKEPFLAFTFTSTTHFPYVLPGKKYALYPHNPKSIAGFLNTLHYTDAMIGDFMKRAKKQPWFDNTIFIFMADHTAPMPRETVHKFEKKYHIDFPKRSMERYRIPILFYAPKLIKPGTIHTPLSQASILPTLLQMSKISLPFSTLSNSVLDTGTTPLILIKEGEQYGIITDSGSKVGSLKEFIETRNNCLSRLLLSSLQTYSVLYIKK